MINRKYFELIEKELKFDEITAIVGSRRVGKTTIMKYLYEKYKDKSVFLTFDDIDVLKTFELDEKLFKQQYVDNYDIIFIDEIQYSKQSGRILKYLFDTTNKKFFISGSSVPEVSINSLSYLVGRVRIFNVYPLTFKEFINYQSKEKLVLFDKLRKVNSFNQIKDDFEQYLKYGGYPKIVTLDLQDKQESLNFLKNTYLLKEIKEILQYNNLFEFETFLKYIALMDGGLINKSSISKESNISVKKIQDMINTLSNTYIITIVYPYLKNKIKEQIKSSKIYFSDLGFKNSLINNFNELNLRSDKGNILENFILSQLIRAGYQVRFWNYKNRSEIDFVIEKNDKIIGIECKSNLKKANFTNSIKKFIETFNPNKVFVLNMSLDEELKCNNTNVSFMNYFNFISQIDKLFD